MWARSSAASDGMAADQRFVLPAVVDGDMGNLLAALASYAAMDPAGPIVLDCARLVRIGFKEAGDRDIELRELNHLVAALLRLLNYHDCARLYAHKY